MKKKLILLTTIAIPMVAPLLCAAQGPPPDPARRKALLDKFDANSDGHLSPSEMAAARPEGRPGHFPPPGERESINKHVEKVGENGLRNDEAMQALFEKFDTNGDSKLSATEMEALRKARPAREATP